MGMAGACASSCACARAYARACARTDQHTLANAPQAAFFWDVQSDNDGDWSWRGRWCVGIGPSVRPSDLALRPVRGRVGAWVCGCVGARVCGAGSKFSCVGDSGTCIRISKFLGLSYNKVHQGKWPCAARQILCVEVQHHSKGGGSAIRCFVI